MAFLSSRVGCSLVADRFSQSEDPPLFGLNQTFFAQVMKSVSRMGHAPNLNLLTILEKGWVNDHVRSPLGDESLPDLTGKTEILNREAANYYTSVLNHIEVVIPNEVEKFVKRLIEKFELDKTVKHR